MTTIPQVIILYLGNSGVYLKIENGYSLNHSTNLDTLNSMLNHSTRGGRSNEKSYNRNSGEVPES